VNDIKLYHGDCIEVMKDIPDSSVDMVLTDPPYYKVKGEDWDRQWNKPDEFLCWLDGAIEHIYRVLKPNGSLYLFASPKMSARVEVLIGLRLNVLNNIRWVKQHGWHKRAKKEEARMYQTPWEACIFAEHYGADNVAKGEAGYQAKCDKLRGFVFESLRAYLVGEFERAGLNTKKGKILANVACGFSATSGGMASRHYFSKSQWCLPTEQHYKALRELLNKNGGEYLTREYEELRKEYEELRKEYEELRRPFSMSADVPYTDVWTFDPVKPYAGKHPCEKPQELLKHAINASTKEGAVVLDAFMGTGSTGVACVNTNRKFIGIELDENYYKIAQDRIKLAQDIKDRDIFK
jgi:adenine-specific DNA-methyltransferase